MSNTNIPPQQPQQPYQQQPYAPQGYYPGYNQPAPWNALAILGFIFAFMFFPVGLVLSIIAVKQIRSTHERGKELAIAGIIISGLELLAVVAIIAVVVIAAASVGTMTPTDSGFEWSYSFMAMLPQLF